MSGEYIAHEALDPHIEVPYLSDLAEIYDYMNSEVVKINGVDTRVFYAPIGQSNTKPDAETKVFLEEMHALTERVREKSLSLPSYASKPRNKLQYSALFSLK